MDARLEHSVDRGLLHSARLLPGQGRKRPAPRHRRQPVTLCVAQAIIGHPLRSPLLAVARKRLVHLYPTGRASRPTSSAAAAWPTPSSGSWASLPPQARALPTTCCSATRRRSSVWLAARETALRSALGEVAGYGYCRLAEGAPSSGPAVPARPLRPRWYAAGARAGRPARDEREVALELLARGARRRAAARREGSYAGRAFAAAPRHSASPWCVPSAATSAAGELTWRRSGSASSRSGRPRTCSPWSATGRAPWPACASACCQRFLCLAACIALNHRLGGRAALWSATAPVDHGRGINHPGARRRDPRPCL